MATKSDSIPEPVGDADPSAQGKTDPTDEKKRTGVPGATPNAACPLPDAASSPVSNWRFRSRRDVCRGLESLVQMGLMGALPKATLKDLSGILRAIGALLPKDEAAGSEEIPESLRELVAQNPQLLESLQHLLTEDQLRQLLRKDADRNRDGKQR